MDLVPAPPPQAIGGERVSEDDFLRFLTVCRFDVPNAATMLRADFEWRRSMRPRALKYKGATSGCRGWTVLERRTAILKMPITSVITSDWSPGAVSRVPGRSAQESVKHITFFMEEMNRRMPKKRGVTGAVMLLDMRAFRMKLLVPFVRDGVALCQAHYPCRLGACLLYTSPSPRDS